MSKFKKKTGGEAPAISTASLPDIVFMLLFFFMVSTVMREVTYKVKIVVPSATDVRKIAHRSLVSYIYVGKPLPRYRDLYGKEPVIQLNDVIAKPSDIPGFVASERSEKNEDDAALLTFSIKSDRDVNMGVISDVKDALREAQAYRVMYSARKGSIRDNLK